MLLSTSPLSYLSKNQKKKKKKLHLYHNQNINIMKYRNIGISSVGFASGIIESRVSPSPFIHLAQNVSQNGTTSDIYQNFTSDGA
jgi:hypothetical protein